MAIRTPTLTKIIINTVDVTTALLKDIVSFVYSDILFPGDSTFELTLDNYTVTATQPAIGDYMEVRIGYVGGGLEFTTGTLRVDDIERTYGYNRVRIGARAFDYGVGIATAGKVAYFNQSINAIVNDIASQYSLSVIGNISLEKAGVIASGQTAPSFSNSVSRLDLLRQLALMYGYAFNLKKGYLFFQNYYTLIGGAPTKNYTTADISPSPIFRQKTAGLSKQCQVLYSPNNLLLVTDPNIPAASTLLDVQSEGLYPTQAAAQLRAQGALLNSNKDWWTGQIVVEGSTGLASGNNVALIDLGVDAGNYSIQKAVHTIAKESGWRTQLDLRRF